MKLKLKAIALVYLLAISGAVGAAEANQPPANQPPANTPPANEPPANTPPPAIAKPPAPIDILVVSDDSHSMAIDHSPENYAKFSQGIQLLQGLDWAAAVTNADITLDSDVGLYVPLRKVNGLDSYVIRAEDPSYANLFAGTVVRLELSEYAHNMTYYNSIKKWPTFGNWNESPFTKGERGLVAASNTLLRPGARLAIVYFTDEDAGDAEYADKLIGSAQSLVGEAGSVTFYAIMVQPGDEACYDQEEWRFSEPMNKVAYGEKLDSIVRGTGGISESICADNYNSIFADIRRLSER